MMPATKIFFHEVEHFPRRVFSNLLLPAFAAVVAFPMAAAAAVDAEGGTAFAAPLC